MNVADELRSVLDEVLSLGGRASQFSAGTALLGAVPELDSMAVVAIITRMEEHFGFTVGDDDIDGETFATFGALCQFVEAKLAEA